MRALLFVDRDRRNYNVSVQSVHNGAKSTVKLNFKSTVKLNFELKFLFCVLTTISQVYFFISNFCTNETLGNKRQKINV